METAAFSFCAADPSSSWPWRPLAAGIGNRLTAQTERSLTTTVSDIEHVESTSLSGVSVIKIFFQPNANIQTALEQVVGLPLQGGKEMTIPTNALMFRAEGIRVAAVDAAGKVKLVPVKVGRDSGPSVEVIDGIRGDERLVMNPGDCLAEGDSVTVAQ